MERLVVVEDGDGRVMDARVVAATTAMTDREGQTRVAIEPGRELRVTSDGHCARTLRLPQKVPAIVRVSLARRIDLGPDRGQVGYDAEVTLDARLGCPTAGARVRWERVEGDAASNTPIGGSGRRFRFRTAPFPRETLARIPVGVVPISPRTQGRVVWRAILEEPGLVAATDEVVVTAAARTQGVPSVPLGTDVYLAAAGNVTVETRAPRSLAEPQRAGDGIVRFRGDVAGRYTFRVESAAGEAHEVLVRVGRYDDTPLDCGRSECHVAESSTTGSTPMSTFLSRALTGQIAASSLEAHLGSTTTPADASVPPGDRGRSHYPGGPCLRCHAVGVEEGIETGGFDDVLRGVGLKPADLVHAASWTSMPREARRLAGVGCLACHGPGAIPEPTARPLIYRADICATCHDAPPRYAHVAAWRESAMSDAHRTLESAATRVTVEPACLECHTSAGFVAHADGRPAPAAELAMLEGVACAACHDPHDARQPSMLRLHATARVDGAELTGLGSGAVCVGCHRAGADGPGPTGAAPAAGQLAMLLGTGGLRADGSALIGQTPHRAVSDACVGCHLERGSSMGHTFAAPAIRARTSRSEPRCLPCHTRIDGFAALQTDIETQLHDTQTAIDVAIRGAAPTACNPSASAAHRLVVRGARFTVEDVEGRALGDCNADGVLEPGETGVPELAERDAILRAAWNVALVERDRSRGAHNASYARALLEAARQALVP